MITDEKLMVTTFVFGEDVWGLDSDIILEVKKILPITPVFGAHDSIAGVINLRGEIVTVLDVKKRLGIADDTFCNPENIIIIDYNNEPVGFLVDSISDVREYDHHQISEPPVSMSGINKQHVAGVINTEEELIILANAETLFRLDTDA